MKAWPFIILISLQLTPPHLNPLPSGERVVRGDSSEIHLEKVKQLTFGGENAEAYFSYDGKSLSFNPRGTEGNVIKSIQWT